MLAGSALSAAGPQPLLRVERLVKAYPLARPRLLGPRPVLRAVDDVSFDVEASETFALVGESGSGKTTVGRLILRLTPPNSGRIVMEGEDLLTLEGDLLRRRRRRMQMVFQDAFAAFNPRLAVRDIVAEPLIAHGLCAHEAIDARVASLLRDVGLGPELRVRLPHELSGGQRQRVGIARALAAEPRLIVADEPLSALDLSVQAQILNLLADLRDRHGIALILISHDLAVVRHIADRVAVMYRGTLVELGPANVVFERPRHPYTRALVAAAPVPMPGARARSREALRDPDEGDPPQDGCPFRHRCPHADDRCADERPALGDASSGHRVACHHHRHLPPLTLPTPVHHPTSLARLRRLQACFQAGHHPGGPPP
jgi:oligopeptide transport system ATP-binding protein